MALHQNEWSLQRSVAALLSKALPPEAYWTSIDVGRSKSEREGALRRQRGVKPGIPDMLIVWNGATLWLELKAGSSLSAPQAITARLLRANGHLWELCRSPEDVEAACRAAGIPLRATLGEIRTRIAEQNERLPAKPKRARAAKAGPRFAGGKGFARRPAGKGILM